MAGGKKRKSRDVDDAPGASASALADPPPIRHDSDADDSSSSDDDSLVLEGAVVRNPEASDDDEDDISSEEDGPTFKKARSRDSSSKRSSKFSGIEKQPKSIKKKGKSQPETINVEFLFCDMHERFFHGMKTLTHRFGIHAPHSSQLSDLLIDNIMLGTVLTTDDPNDGKKTKESQTPKFPGQEEDNVFGYASMVNLNQRGDVKCIQDLKKLCLKYCPAQYHTEMSTVLSGKTKRPAGFLFHERMVNVPLEITEVLHQQLLKDIDHAIETADDDDERKSVDFGAFVRLAPCYAAGGGTGAIYKYFDDEIFATNAEFTYVFDVPRMHEDEDEEKMICTVIVMTKTGHRAAMKDLNKLISQGGA
ncbi:hypothetical protein THAOC_03338 [Thalassiosira oceanica]|uniref:Uncharacterized protein n=1 Tax=Thalassiosira oceanica TaxID=159749 RepID=K0TBS3_THAOC|nr:hypothetical protein THAOC_03338 [Thalassiosira oceanica]|mmetsp:Transcript_30930/g.73720  ORF Transcript_30930/g.73720 Transcript_30930/m.73720 type:complete len:362 (+) Transcript_30930:125-1210(+)|eukprot:EJK74955.1 hypothetical protein THAOC_03338 [Thalassiosira oceanica]